MRTYLARLELSKEDGEKLHHTLELHSLAWNMVSQLLFETGPIPQTIAHNKTYSNVRKSYPNMPSQVVIKARMDCLAAYKTAKSNKIKLDKPMERKNLAMRLDKWLFGLTREGSTLTAKFTVAGSKRCRVKGNIVTYPKLEEAMAYELADPLVFERDGEFWLAMSFRNPEATHVRNSCVGIDLGLKRLAVTSEGVIFHDKQLLKIKRKTRYLRACLRRTKILNKSKCCGKHLKKLARKEKHVTKDHLHILCNGILASTKATTLVIEDLSKIKFGKKKTDGKKEQGTSFRSRKGQVPWFEMIRILTYKAQALGKRVETVDPRYTSKDDYRGLERGVRKGCRYHAVDGVVLDADHNAAINIAKRWTVQNELPISFMVPFDGTQTLWAGCGQTANRGDALQLAGASLAYKPTASAVGI